MSLIFLQEPSLEFGRHGTHIDIRYGLKHFGPLDIDEVTAPKTLRIGLVGTGESIDSIRQWFERCRQEVTRKKSKLRNLFLPFPGFNEEAAFHASLVFHDKWCSPIRPREIQAVLAHANQDDVIDHAAELFLDHCEELVQQGGPMVLVCAPPENLLAAVDESRTDSIRVQEQELDEGSETQQPETSKSKESPRYFHDVLKARGMRLSVPLQMVRPRTYSLETKRKKGSRTLSAPIQDEATRAWNIHTALYYKAGGIPWRLLRSASDLMTCFVGVSFYKTIEGDKLLTSVAQVFNERGQGVIVKGPQAKQVKDDKTPYLTEPDAHALIKTAIGVYRKEHRTSPARVVVHKTSRVTDDELSGFSSAASEHDIDTVELLTVRKSFTRLYREGSYPPLRGTFLRLTDSSALLYLKGSVDFFATYPGMYVPRPLEFSVHQAETPLEQLAKEMFSLSKLNWNNTQFDGGEPITVRAARRVGDILKCVPEGANVQPTFRFFM